MDTYNVPSFTQIDRLILLNILCLKAMEIKFSLSLNKVKVNEIYEGYSAKIKKEYSYAIHNNIVCYFLCFQLNLQTIEP